MRKSKYEKVVLTRLSDADAKKLLASAKFVPPLWQHQVWFFGRGESTTYYLVDSLLRGGAGFRLYIGPKGQMKQKKVVDFANDTGGSLVITKGGELKISRDRKTAVWTQGKRTIDLIPLDDTANSYLIYRELGVYGQLGAICEDQ